MTLLVQILGGVLIVLGIYLVLARALGMEGSVQLPGVAINVPASVLVLLVGVGIFLFPLSPWWPDGRELSPEVTATTEGVTTTPEETTTTSEDGAGSEAPTTTTEPQGPCVPEAIAPQEGALLDNGRTDRQDNVEWRFSWVGCPETDEYQLVVIGPTATLPLLDTTVTSTRFDYVGDGSYIADSNRVGWTWRVRARIEGEWSDWLTGTFDVEPVNTD